MNLIAVSISVLIYAFYASRHEGGNRCRVIFSSDETFSSKIRLEWFHSTQLSKFSLCKEEYICLQLKIVPSLVPP